MATGGAGRCPRCVRLWAGVVPFGRMHFSVFMSRHKIHITLKLIPHRAITLEHICLF